MPTQPLARLLGNVRKTLAAHQRDDVDLLDRYRRERDPDALDALVRKHAPLVLAACRKVLPDADADDVFQATFLVLMRDAKSIRKGQSVGAWLYGVAHRLALQARSSSARRSRIERKSGPKPAANLPDLSWREACAALHEELNRLPDAYRLPLLLCYVEGKSRDEAAAELGWTLNRVRGQLERGRVRLRDRLERRGIALSAGLLAAVAGNSTAADGTPARLIQSALGATGGQPSVAARALANGAPRMTIPAKITLAASVVCVSAAITFWQFPQPVADAHQAAKTQVPGKDEPAQKANAAIDPLAPESVEVSGQVLDPDGKPVAGAKVTYLQDPLHDDVQALYPDATSGMTDRDGKFRFAAMMYAKAPNGHEPMGRITAAAPGYAPAGSGTGLPESMNDRTLRLAKDDAPLENRFLDLEGRPIAGITARCVHVVVSPKNDLGPWLNDIRENKLLPGGTTPGLPIPAHQLGIDGTATSDKDGRIKLPGVGRGRVASVRLDGPTIESHLVWVMTDDHETVRVPQHRLAYSLFEDQPVYGRKSDIAVAPCTPVEGVVKDLDTRKPIAGARVFNKLNVPMGWDVQVVETKTDGQGRYRLMGRPNRTGNRVTVTPPPGEPYLLTADYPPRVEPGKSATLNFQVKRGVFITGRVTDATTGKPHRANVEYKAWPDNPHVKGIHPVWRSTTISSVDGSYRLVGLPGRGAITVQLDFMRRNRCVIGAGAESILAVKREGQSLPALPDRIFPNMVNCIAEVDLKADAETMCNLTVTTGKTVRGAIVGPDGKPISGTMQGVIGAGVYSQPSKNGEFSLSAIDPRSPKPFFFHNREKNLAAAVIIKGDEPDGFTVKLQAASTISGRLLDDAGTPLADAEISGGIDDGQLNIKGGWYGFFYGRTDKEGRFKIAALIPGVKLSARIMRNYSLAEQIFENQAFGAGELKELGDIKVKPAKD
jgi:RNA polymerase sigma factor (sigma-70 family)